MSDDTGYGLSPQPHTQHVPAPELPYLPRLPRSYRPKIGLIGAGGIAEYHLRAYRALELDVVAIADIQFDRAVARRDEFYPAASVSADYGDVLRRDDIEVVDLALHPRDRVPVLEAAIAARKHILSQKPFAEDLDVAERLVALADRHNVRLAVNLNGRWAPHFAYARAAAQAGLFGEISTIDFQLAFDHSWTIGTPFEKIRHLVLYDFGIHWFDMVNCLLSGHDCKTVYAAVGHARYQTAKPPFLATAVIDAGDAQARLSLNAAVTFGQSDQTVIAGSLGTMLSTGPSLSEQQVRFSTAAGIAVPQLRGTWFENGFQGTMAELLCAIEEQREPTNSARNNLRSLALCFAAVQSADTGLPVAVGAARRLADTQL